MLPDKNVSNVKEEDPINTELKQTEHVINVPTEPESVPHTTDVGYVSMSGMITVNTTVTT